MCGGGCMCEVGVCVGSVVSVGVRCVCVRWGCVCVCEGCVGCVWVCGVCVRCVCGGGDGVGVCGVCMECVMSAPVIAHLQGHLCVFITQLGTVYTRGRPLLLRPHAQTPLWLKVKKALFQPGT